MLTDAIIKNDYKIDAVFAHNDIFAGAAAEVVKELGIKNPVIITGMDAETPALKRLLGCGQRIGTVCPSYGGRP